MHQILNHHLQYLFDMKMREMNDDELSIFITLNTISKEECESLYIAFANKSWVLRAIHLHSLAMKLQLEKKVLIMLLTLGDGVIGCCLKYLHVIKKWADLQGQTVITFNDFSTKVFPFGFPDFNDNSTSKTDWI